MDENDRPLADRRTNPYRSAMQIDERARDRKTKPRALHAIVQCSAQLFEWPAKPCQRRRWNAHSGIFYIDVQSTLDHPRADADAAVIWGVFHRIAQEDREDLFNRLAVGMNALARKRFGDNADFLFGGDRFDLRDRGTDRSVDLEVGLLNHKPARFEARHIENILDHVAQAFATLLYVLAIFGIF